MQVKTERKSFPLLIGLCLALGLSGCGVNTIPTWDEQIKSAHQQVVPETWHAIVDEFTDSLKAGDVYGGFEACIKPCGTILLEKVPPSHARDELPNHLIVID